jgi:hypothetical protein
LVAGQFPEVHGPGFGEGTTTYRKTVSKPALLVTP